MVPPWRAHVPVDENRINPPSPADVISNALLAVAKPDATSNDVRLVHLLLRDNILDEEDVWKTRRTQCTRIVDTALFYKTDVGRRAVVDVIVKADCDADVCRLLFSHLRRSITTGSTSSATKHISDVVWRLWRLVEKGEEERRANYERYCVQSIVRKAVHCPLAVASVMRAIVVGAFVGHKELRAVDALLHRVVQPILWRAFEMTNEDVGFNASKLFLALFPFRNMAEGTIRFRDDFNRQLQLIIELLSSEDVRVRLTAVTGSYKVLASLWTMLPAAWMRRVITHVLTQTCIGDAAVEVRLAVITGVNGLLDNCVESRVPVGKVLPHVCQLGIDDPSDKVRLATVKLATNFSKLDADTKFFDLISVCRLLQQLVVETSTEVCNTIVLLLQPSFVPSGRRSDDGIALRLRTQIKFNVAAARIFYRHAVNVVKDREALFNHVMVILGIARLRLANKEEGADDLSNAHLAALLDVAVIIATGMQTEMDDAAKSGTRKKFHRVVTLLGKEHMADTIDDPSMHAALLALCSLVPVAETDKTLCRTVMASVSTRGASDSLVSAGASWNFADMLHKITDSLKKPTAKSSLPLATSLSHLQCILKSGRWQSALIDAEDLLPPLVDALLSYRTTFLQSVRGDDDTGENGEELSAVRLGHVLNLIRVNNNVALLPSLMTGLRDSVDWLVAEVWPLLDHPSTSAAHRSWVFSAATGTMHSLLDAADSTPFDDEALCDILDRVKECVDATLTGKSKMVADDNLVSLASLTVQTTTSLCQRLGNAIIEKSTMDGVDHDAPLRHSLQQCVGVLVNLFVMDGGRADESRRRSMVELADEEGEEEDHKQSIVNVYAKGFARMMATHSAITTSPRLPLKCRSSLLACLPLAQCVEHLIAVAIRHLAQSNDESDTCDDARLTAFQCHPFVYALVVVVLKEDKEVCAVARDRLRARAVDVDDEKYMNEPTACKLGALLQLCHMVHKHCNIAADQVHLDVTAVRRCFEGVVERGGDAYAQLTILLSQ